MAFVKYHQIPGLSLEQAFQVILLLKSIHGADDTVVHLPLARLIDEKILAIDLEVFELELVIELFLPLLG
ncbi:hypothetical protein D9M69_699170 [compost metagenome]